MNHYRHILGVCIVTIVGLSNPLLSLGDNPEGSSNMAETNYLAKTNSSSNTTDSTNPTGEKSFKSPKRGICWEEGKVNLNARHASMLTPGVSWAYNWGPAPAYPDIYSADFYFVPMAWNAAYDAAKIREWLKDHPETRYLLGFNEPNFSDQAKMTPAQAAEAWPGLEAIAEEFDVKLVAPALNFSNSQVEGKVWGIYEWYDEFFRLYPEARVDCLALHCYMNWYTAMNWFVTEYFYKDLYNPSNENYGKFPHLVKFLDDYKETHDDFPHMMLTEFCGWEYDYLPDVYFQIDQMTQKVQMLEQSEIVDGYAWFMGNFDGGATAFPYMSIFQTNSPTSQLSELGKVYVYMSAFDTSRFYTPGESVMAKDYINASTDNQQVKVRPNSEEESSIPLQIEIPAGGKCEYLIDAPADGTYTFTVHCKSSGNSALTLYSDAVKSGEAKTTADNSEWSDMAVSAELPAGQQTLTLANSGSSVVTINAFAYALDSSGVERVASDDDAIPEVFTIQGVSLGNVDLKYLSPGIYMVRKANGKTVKLLK